MGVEMLSMMKVFVTRVPVKEISYLIRRMAWFFLAIIIFPILLTPGLYIDMPSWLPITVSKERLALELESSVHLLKTRLVCLVLVRTTFSEY
jgi:hypothetical protein